MSKYTEYYSLHLGNPQENIHRSHNTLFDFGTRFTDRQLKSGQVESDDIRFCEINQ